MGDSDQNKVLKHVRFLVLFAGSAGCIQSLIWIILTIIGIIFNTTCIEPSQIKSTNLFANYLITMYFTEETCGDYLGKDFYVTSSDLLVWECVILALTVLWLITSILLFAGVKEKMLNENSILYLIMWSTMTLIISAVDLGLGIMFGLDVGNIANRDVTPVPPIPPNPPILNAELFQNYFMACISGFLMAVALRGFVMWVINVATAIYFIIAAVEINNIGYDKNEMTHNTVTRGPLNAYEGARPMHWLTDSQNVDSRSHAVSRNNYNPQGEINSGFVHSMNNPGFQQQKPLANIMQSSVAARNEDRTGIMKPKEPYTPTPDYSPQMYRNNRPALKHTTTNNNYSYANNFKR